MKEPHGEDLASHPDPKPCDQCREALVEASVGALVSPVLSCEIAELRVRKCPVCNGR